LQVSLSPGLLQTIEHHDSGGRDETKGAHGIRVGLCHHARLDRANEL